MSIHSHPLFSIIDGAYTDTPTRMFSFATPSPVSATGNSEQIATKTSQVQGSHSQVGDDL